MSEINFINSPKQGDILEIGLEPVKLVNHLTFKDVSSETWKLVKNHCYQYDSNGESGDHWTPNLMAKRR